NRQLLSQVLPDLFAPAPGAQEAIIAHFQRFALAGLEATAAEIKREAVAALN
ncbi:TPA: hypothetical protein IHM15_004574, partial [Escherichia coli]|nr:hypothetical protein [Escherichia coli]